VFIFLKFFFKNIETNKIYKLHFEIIYNPENGGRGVEMKFDFLGISPGKYILVIFIKKNDKY